MDHHTDTHDVIVVGASLAGCAAARLYGAAGLRVALVERDADPAGHKRMCTHFIQAGAVPTLKRLGVTDAMERAGAVRNGIEIWTRHGWVSHVPALDENGAPMHGYNMTRRRLDPLLREAAATTPGVELLAGRGVVDVVDEGGVVRGVRLAGRDAPLRAALVVAADGRVSPLGALAGVVPRESPNCRFGATRAFRGVGLRRGSCSQMWLRDPEVGYVFPNEDDVTVLAYMSSKDRLDGFRDDPDGALVRAISTFPEAPDLSRAEPLGRTLLVKDYSNLWRPPTAAGIAFVGDALMTLDYLWGVGCGFALRTAEWLVDATAPALASQAPLAPALASYARRVRRELTGHRFLINDFSRRPAMNPIERLMFSAATRSDGFARHMFRYGNRLVGPATFLSPWALAWAAMLHVRRPRPLTQRLAA